MLNIQENLHRSPYEELQSINEDGFIVGLRFLREYNPIMESDYALGRLFNLDYIKDRAHHFPDLESLLEKSARKYPVDCPFGIYTSLGFNLTKYLIDRPDASWGDVYRFLKNEIKSFSYWMADDESEGYVIMIISPVPEAVESFPNPDDNRIYESKSLVWRHTVILRWTDKELLTMNTAINENGYPYVSFHIGEKYFSNDGLHGEWENKPYFVGGEYLSLISLMKPVKLGILNMGVLGTPYTGPQKLPDLLAELDRKRERRRRIQEGGENE